MQGLHDDAIRVVLDECYAVHVARFFQASARKHSAGLGVRTAVSIWQTWAVGACAPAVLQALMLSERSGRRDLCCLFLHEIETRVRLHAVSCMALRRSILYMLGGDHPVFVHVWRAGGAEVVQALLKSVEVDEAVWCLKVCIECVDCVGVCLLLGSLQDRLSHEERVCIAREARSHAVQASGISVHLACEHRLQIDLMVQDALGMLTT